MGLTRKTFLLRASAATVGLVATSLAGTSEADAFIWFEKLRPVLELTTNAARQLNRLEGLYPPGPCMPETQAALEAIRAASADLSATTDRMLGACRS